MTIQTVVVAGGGTLGSQIAYQTAYSGFNTTIYDINDDAIAAAKKRVATWATDYVQDIQATPEQIQAASDHLSFSTDLASAVHDADLVIEAVPEVPAIKDAFYQSLAKVAPAKTIFTTNSSTLLPSQFAAETGRPKQFLAMHFANRIWMNNTAEIMGHPGTDPAVYDTIVAFAKQIGMVPIKLKKEQPAYILNTLLIPLLNAGGLLWVKGVADPETIDMTWMLATGAPMGPFAILDAVGLRTVYNITLASAKASHDELLEQFATKLKAEFLDQGKLGQESGSGFYTYPNPDYQKPDFLKGH